MNKKTLHLRIKKKWFDMIRLGEMKEIYKEFNDYWKSRLGIKQGSKLAKTSMFDYPDLHSLMSYLDVGYDCVPRYDYTHVKLYNGGYVSNKFPNFEIQLKEISIEEGNPEWGAERGKIYFVLKLKHNTVKPNHTQQQNLMNHNV